MGPKKRDSLENGREDSLRFYAVEGFDYRKTSSADILEPLNEEIQRRSRVVGVFPSVDSYVRLISCYLLEYSEDCAVSRNYIKQSRIEEFSERMKKSLSNGVFDG